LPGVSCCFPEMANCSHSFIEKKGRGFVIDEK